MGEKTWPAALAVLGSCAVAAGALAGEAKEPPAFPGAEGFGAKNKRPGCPAEGAQGLAQI